MKASAVQPASQPDRTTVPPTSGAGLRTLFDDAQGNLRCKVIGIYGILFLLNAGGLWAAVAFRHFPLLLGTALLAYSFGLRHAVDADHIAAIDNVTRKLMQEGKRPVAVGFMFSLGHSTIVVLGLAAIAATALALQHSIDAARDIGGVIGTLVSSLFLIGIAIVNIFVLVSIYRAFVRVRNGAPYVDEDFDMLLASRGFLARLFRPMFAMIRHSGTSTRSVCCLASASTPRPRSACWASPLPKRRAAFPSGPSSSSLRCLPQACRLLTPRTIF